MNVRLLIEGIVRQMTVLLAELATSGGLRAPLANVADQVFMDLARELDGHGVSRSVSADMFGLALRTYLRKIQRHDESLSQKGTSLWEAVLRFVESRSPVSRSELLDHFAKDDDALVRSVLQDLTDSGLVFRSGVRSSVVYRAATAEDMKSLKRAADPEALDNMLWALVRREGPFPAAGLVDRLGIRADDVEASIGRLLATDRIERTAEGGAGTYRARSIVIPLGERSGWEAAVYDHVHAVVKTIVCKLRNDAEGASPSDRVGGSTYSFEMWEEHPLAAEVYGHLSRYRQATTELRRRVEDVNSSARRPSTFDRVTVYLGQCVISESEERQ